MVLDTDPSAQQPSSGDRTESGLEPQADVPEDASQPTSESPHIQQRQQSVAKADFGIPAAALLAATGAAAACTPTPEPQAPAGGNEQPRNTGESLYSDLF